MGSLMQLQRVAAVGWLGISLLLLFSLGPSTWSTWSGWASSQHGSAPTLPQLKKLYLCAVTVARPNRSASSHLHILICQRSIGYQLHPKVGIPSPCTTPLTGLGPGTKTFPSSLSPNVLAPLCAAWREEPLCREDANSEAWSDCASPRLLTQCHLLGAALLLVCAQVCLRAHPQTQVPVSIFLSPGKPATPPELLLHDGPLALWSAAPAGSRASAATAGCSPGPKGSS